ncbi:thiolase family protein [Planctomycetota bacterium]
MALEKSYVPYGAYWTTPFCRWQGSLSQLHALKLSAQVADRFLNDGNVPREVIDGVVLGMTVPQRHSFYGAPWLAGLMGAPEVAGPTVAQACATAARMIAMAALELETGQRECLLCVACDRTSNGPHVYYPNPLGVGGTGESENPVMDNFQEDPFAKNAMIETAEKVAKEVGITREEQDEVALLRYQQYQDALADDRAFQRRYMVPVELTKRGKTVGLVESDEGVQTTSAEGLARLRPVLEQGTVTYGTQTHPADGNAGILLCTRERAKELSSTEDVTVRVLGYGEARVAKGFMPMAPVPAARHALERAGVNLDSVGAIKTHNPFALNDVYFCRETGVSKEDVNRFGSPLIWGHPQAPTGLRALIELIEELKDKGGGIGLFTGCAAGDTGMALVIRLD